MAKCWAALGFGRRLAGCLLGVLGLLGRLAAAQPTAPLPDQLTVGSELSYPPFALVKPNQEADGFTVELWKAVAHEAGLSSTIRVGPFHTILEGFRAGEIDVMINLAQSDARREFCNFAVPHVTMYGAIFVRKGEKRIQSDADLPDRELIVLNKDLAHDYAVTRGWTNHLVLVDDAASGLRMLAEGRHDAMLVGKLVGLNTLRELNLANVQPVGARINFQQKFAFAVLKSRPGSSDLLAKINEGLALVKANGTYDLLYEKWFGVLEPRSFSLAQILRNIAPFLVLSLLASCAYVLERRLRIRMKQTVSLLNATLESTAEGIVAVNGNGQVTAFNKRVLAQGLAPAELISGAKAAHVPLFTAICRNTRESPDFQDSIFNVQEHPELESFDTIRLQDERCFEVVSIPQKLDGVNQGRVWSFRDVTRRERAAEQIRKFNQELEQRVRERTLQLEAAGRDLERLSYVASRTRNGVLICNPEGRIEWANQGFERMSGWLLSEIVGRKPGEFLQGAGTDLQVVSEIRRALRSRVAIQFTLLNYTKSGERYWVEAEINPVFDKAGGLISFVSVQADITERRLAEEKMRQQNERVSDMNAHLEQALRSRDGFLAAMSHELRTPLHGVLGLAELLLDPLYGQLTPKQEHFLHRIRESGNHLLELINDILDLAKIQSGSALLEREECEVAEISWASVRLIEESAKLKKQELRVTLPAAGTVLRADVRRLKQILVNLLGNAVKFTNVGGRIGLDVTCGEQEIRFEVWDTGLGISADNIAKLFQPFVQLDHRLARDHAGTGLGLALVRQLVDAHGGRVEVSSTVGVGSRFTAVFPWSPKSTVRSVESQGPADAVGPGQASAFRPGFLILVAEDNPVNLLTLRSFLESRGAVVLVAENGKQAIQLAEAKRPEIVLMDIQMNQMDGLEATARIRRLPHPQLSQVPIIALTALAMPGDRERCLAAGVSAYMTKPTQMSNLMRLIAQLVPDSIAKPPV